MANESVRPGEVDDDVIREWNQMRLLVNEIRATVAQLVTLTTELRTDHNTLVTKLDSDAGVTDTNYNSLTGISSVAATALTQPDVDSFSENF